MRKIAKPTQHKQGSTYQATYIGETKEIAKSSRYPFPHKLKNNKNYTIIIYKYGYSDIVEVYDKNKYLGNEYYLEDTKYRKWKLTYY